MNVPTDIQIITGGDGNPAFVVIPYDAYMRQRPRAGHYVPDDVVRRVITDGETPIRAWREHLGLTQADMAARLNITQSAYAQQEVNENPRKTTKVKIAAALGVDLDQLSF